MTFCKFKEAVSMKLQFLHAAVFDKGIHVSVFLPKRMGWGLDKKGEFLKFKQKLHTHTKLQKYYKKKPTQLTMTHIQTIIRGRSTCWSDCNK